MVWMTQVIAVQLEGTDSIPLRNNEKLPYLGLIRVIIMMRIIVTFPEVLIMFQILFQALHVYIS